ncbi:MULTISPECIES: hypothetical protein [unclassified Pseudomonas]|uniref:hypothetical protein n=1 Tax=unclassified Pseudomonas TaxID=196821 RepID=UPI0021DA50A5|nr:hypothetical protein [Pseudomonas sp. YeP6b]UXZ25599.1 hypothetical protein KZH41_16240 [Pseudomonas sp. YeP6b]
MVDSKARRHCINSVVFPKPAGATTSTRGPLVRSRKESSNAWRGKEVSNVNGGASLPTQHQALDEADEEFLFKTSVSHAKVCVGFISCFLGCG